MENKDYIITYMGKCYAIDLDALKKVCLISDNQKGVLAFAETPFGNKKGKERPSWQFIRKSAILI